jgi:Fatty acid hydroxylase superfamily
MIFVPLLIHDCWFYWSHRIEHKVPILWEFHKLHHSDEQMNASTWARDHFLQESWRAFFSVFTLGLIVDLHLAEAGKAALYSTTFLIGMSMFYHSAIRVRLPWLIACWSLRRCIVFITQSTLSITTGISPMCCRSSTLYLGPITVPEEKSSLLRALAPTSQHPVHCYPRNSARSRRSGSCCDERATLRRSNGKWRARRS